MDKQTTGPDDGAVADASAARGSHYRSLTAALGDGLFRLDADRRFVDVDEGFADVVGTPRADLLGKQVSEVVADGHVDRLQGAIDAVDEGAGAETVPLTVRRADGTNQPVECNIEVADDGSVAGAIERAEAAAGAADGADHPDWGVSTLLENVPGMVYRCRNERGWPMEFVSDAFGELTGYDAEAIESGEISWGEDVMFEEERDRIWEAVQDAVDAGETFSVTYRIETADGRTRWVRDYGRAVPADGGDDVAIEGIIADVTERKRLEAELEEAFGRVSDAFFSLDEEWRFTYLNERAHELINPEGRQLVGKDVWEEFPDAASRKFKTEYERAMDEQVTVSFEEYYPDPLDTWFEVHAYPSETGLSVYFRDITDRKKREQELEQYETIVETIPDGTYVLDEDHCFVAVNETFAEMTGYDREELLGRDAELVSTDDGHERGMELRRQLRDGDIEVAVLEEELEPADGDRFDAEIRFAALEDEDGTFRGTAGAVRDVTERKRRERALEESERRYRTLVENFPNGAVALVDEELRYQTVGGDPTKTAGATADEIEGERLEDAVPSGLAAELRPYYESALDGEPCLFELEREGHVFQFQILPIRDDDGEVFAALGMSQDITERRLHERKLEESERRHRALAEHFPNGIVTLFDTDFEYTLAAGRGFEVIPAEPEDLEGRTFEDAWDDETAEKLRPAFEAALDGEEESIELEYADREWVIRAVPVTDENGEVFAGMTMAQDITQRKETERTLRALNDAAHQLLATETQAGVGDAVFDMVAEVLGFPCVGYYRQADDGKTLISTTDIAEDEFSDQQFLDLPVDGDSLVAGTYASGELHYYSEPSEPSAVRVNSTGVEMRSGLYVPIGDHGVLVAGSCAESHLDERKRRLVEILATNAQAAYERVDREQYLREAKTRLEAATEAGAVGTFEWDVVNDEMVTGEAFAKKFGVDPEAAREGVSLDAFLESIHEDDRDRVERKIEAAVEGCGEYEAEYRVYDADDELRWVVARGHVECEDGAPTTFPGTLTDITERKQAERELRRHKNQLETLFEVLPVGVVVGDEDGNLVEVNDTIREIWGEGVLMADSVEEYDRYQGWWADTGEPVDADEWVMSRVLDGEEVTEPDIYEIETMDGDDRTIMAHGMPVRDENGNVTRGVVTQTDITERRTYQRQLEESEQRYRTLAENFPDGGVGVFDEDLRYTLVTGTMWDDIEPDADELEGKTIWEALPDETAEDVEPLFRGALDGETDSVVSTLGGRTYRVWATPLRDASGEITAGQSIAVDITEQLHREAELKASNERLEQFAYAASHDLQEPLRMVSSYLSLIERRYEEELPEDALEFFEYAVDSAERMREMIDALLEYSRVETQGRPFEPVDLEAVLEDARTDLRMRIEEHNAEISVGSLPEVEGDEDQLRQVFQNLLDNAIEYSGDGRPRIEVDADRDGDEWVVTVRDDGIGIDPEHTDRVFEVFQRLHTQDEHSGTGIGLALCRRIVERHGGDIRAESEGEEGTTFYFTLPVSGGKP